MQTRFVAVEALNVRSSPQVRSDNLIGSVFLGQPVGVAGPSQDGWVPCRAQIDGETRSGFVKEGFLRDPVSPNREALLAAVHAEWMRFARGLGKEHVKPFSGFVGEMWAAIGSPGLDGTDRDVPWSAAAISFMVRRAGRAYGGFRFAAAHSKFTHQAINARLAGDRSVPFWGFRLHEARPQIGDIVVRDNPEFAPAVTFDVAATLDSYRSHSDIVVQIDSARQRLLAIGGNLSHSVGLAVYDLAPGDFLADTNGTFALLRNITDGA